MSQKETDILSVLQAKFKDTSVQFQPQQLGKVAVIADASTHRDVLKTLLEADEKTLMHEDGKVVGESDADTVALGSKLDRPEVQEALEKGEGNSIRFSKTLRIDMLYTAVFLREKGKIIRLAVHHVVNHSDKAVLKPQITAE